MKYKIDYKNKDVIIETLRLVKLAQAGDSRAENKLVNMYEDYVEYMVNKYSMKTLIKDNDDLRSAIYRGMIEGIRRYEDDKGTQFIYFTHNWMKKMIFIEAQQNFRLIRLPVNQSIFKTSFESKYKIPKDTGFDYNVHEDYNILMDNEYFAYMAIKETETSLFSELNEYTDSTDIFIDNINKYSPLSEKEETETRLRKNINRALKKFSDREILIIEKLFGLNGQMQTTAESIANELDMAKVSIINIKTRVVRLLRHNMFTRILLYDI